MTAVRVLEMVGQSDKNWQEAAANAVMEASKSISNIVGAEVINWTANVTGGQIREYRANVKIAYTSESK